MPAPRFFIDRNLGSRIIPDGLRQRGWQVVTMDERYGVIRSQSLTDPDWIRDASERGEACLTDDSAVARRPAEADQIWLSAARVFALANPQVTGEQALAWLLEHESAIMRWATRVTGPYVVAVSARGLRRITLRTTMS